MNNRQRSSVIVNTKKETKQIIWDLFYLEMFEQKPLNPPPS